MSPPRYPTHPPDDLGRPVGPAELAAAIKQLEWAEDDLALLLDADATTMRTWLCGQRAVPRRIARQLRWHLAAKARRDALAASGLPTCDVMERWARDLVDGSVSGNPLERMERMREHEATCPTCKARDQYLADRFPRLRPPTGGGMAGPFAWVVDRVMALPQGLRAPVTGAVALGAIVLARGVFALPRLLKTPGLLREFGIALGAAMGAGAAGGAVYSLVRPPFRRFGVVGDYLTGVTVVMAYMEALLLAAPYAFGEPIAEDRTEAIIFVIVAGFFGLLFGHGMAKARRTGTS